MNLKINYASYYTNDDLKGIDVTELLNNLVVNNCLDVVASNNLAGDPNVGVVKQLLIDYDLNGNKTVIINEGERIIINGKNEKSTEKSTEKTIIITQEKTQEKAKIEIKEKIADIIIPHHNRHDLLKNCLSLIDHDIFNVIVASGGSFAENCNSGAKAAKTDTLIFLNDDVIPDNEILTELAKHETEFTGCAQFKPSEDRLKYGIAYNMKNGKAQGYLALRLEDCLMPTGFCFKIKKKLWNKLGGYDERFFNGAEDQDLGFRALNIGVKFGYIEKPLIHYHSQSKGRFDHTIKNNKLLKELWSDKKIFDIIHKENNRLKILVANHHLSNPNGSENSTLTLYQELKKMGYTVDLYSYEQKANMLAEIVKEPKDEYDLILFSHNTCLEKFRHFRGVKICTVHGTTPLLEQPRIGADVYVSISKEIQSFLKDKGFKSSVVYNGVDRNIFKPLKPINKKLTNILSLCKTPKANVLIKQACDKLGLNLTTIKGKRNVENYINDADLVVSLGRGIYESMSCGRAVIVYDNRNYQAAYADGYLKENINESLKCNFSGRAYKKDLTVEDFIQELSKYDSKDGENNLEYSKEFDSNKQAESYINLYKNYISKESDFEFINSSSTDYGIARQLERQLKALGLKEGGGKSICYGNDMGILNIKQEIATIDNSITLKRYVESHADIKFKSQNLNIEGIHLPSAIDNNIFFDRKLSRIYDLSFVGRISNLKRKEFIKKLQSAFPQVIIKDNIYFEDISKLYNRTKIIANHSVFKEINMRMFEATASGALLITEYVAGLSDFWDINKEIITYKSYSEMKELINYYLKHDSEREKIAIAGQKRTLEKHTYLKRCNKIKGLL